MDGSLAQSELLLECGCVRLAYSECWCFPILFRGAGCGLRRALFSAPAAVPGGGRHPRAAAGVIVDASAGGGKSLFFVLSLAWSCDTLLPFCAALEIGASD